MHSDDDIDTSDQFSTPDSNANISNTEAQSKGAIPKTKSQIKMKSGNRKAVKINNNVEVACNILQNGCNGVSAPFLERFKADASPGEVVNEACSSCATENQSQDANSPICDRLIDDNLDRISNQLDEIVVNGNQSDSSTEDDLLSISDDGCIYTYKGDQMADLPSSFFSLDIPLPDVPEVAPRNQTSSPEMDFLEMDFDPGPMGDGDSECGDLQSTENIPNDKSPLLEKESEVCKVNPAQRPQSISDDFSLPGPSTSQTTNYQNANSLTGNIKKESTKTYCIISSGKKDATPSNIDNDPNIVMPWSCPETNRTTGSNYHRSSKRFHCLKGELISPSEKFSSDCLKVAKMPYYAAYKNEEEWRKDSKNSAMVWSESEAMFRQFTQIGPSACGATAVLNVLTALRFPVPPIEKLQEFVATRLRANSSPLTEYLLSRSVAGTTHEDLIDGLHKLSEGKIYSRFFPMYPERVVNLETWLAYWISKGAVPIATLNLQKCTGTIPDAWHHQMIFGVSPKGIFMTNPLECVSASKLWTQLCSDSTLLIRREDVVSRWNYRTDLPQLMKIMDVRWRNLNVVGQVANMIHEHRRELRPGFINTSHIKVPAAYQSGITLAITADSDLSSFLKQCPQLPLLHPQEVATSLS